LKSNHSLEAPALRFEFGNLDADRFSDAVILSGDRVLLLYGNDGVSTRMEDLSLYLSASAISVGRFVHDRDPRLQLAVLSSDGTIHIVAHTSFDPRPWTGDE